MRDCEHVSLLFVGSRFHRRGIAKVLLRCALRQCMRAKPDQRQVTVNSSANAVEAYEHLGFRA